MDFKKIGQIPGIGLQKESKPIEITRKSSPSSLNYVPKEYKKVAKDMEAEFAKLMIEKMKATVQKETENSTADEIYQSYLGQEYSKAMAQQNEGQGIQELILREIYPQRYRNQITYDSYLQRQKELVDRFKQNKIEIKADK